MVGLALAGVIAAGSASGRDAAASKLPGAQSELGTYTLQSVNGKAIPATLAEGGANVEVVSGSIVLGASSTVTVVTSFRVPPGTGTPQSSTTSGTYRLQGDTLTFTFTNGGGSVGALKGSTIQAAMTEPTDVWIYKKQ
jgi:hypothetical protein